MITWHTTYPDRLEFSVYELTKINQESSIPLSGSIPVAKTSVLPSKKVELGSHFAGL